VRIVVNETRAISKLVLGGGLERQWGLRSVHCCRGSGDGKLAGPGAASRGSADGDLAFRGAPSRSSHGYNDKDERERGR
jgi:hypothetical protein